MAADLDVRETTAEVVRDLHRDIDRLFAVEVAAESDAESLQGLAELERAIRRLPAARSVRSPMSPLVGWRSSTAAARGRRLCGSC